MKIKRNFTVGGTVPRKYKGNVFLTDHSWFAIDRDGELYNFEEEPFRGECCWMPSSGACIVIGTLGEEYTEWKTALEYVK